MANKVLLSGLMLGMILNSAMAEHWLIGLDADMSNVAKAGGIAIEQGIQLAIEEINEAGGLLGKPLKLDARDHRGNPARGIANLRSLHENENLIAVIGGVHTPVAIAELPFIHKAPLIYLDPWAAGTPIIDNGYQPNFAFRLSVRDEWAGQVILSEAKADNCQSVTLLLERTGWGRSNEVSMKKAALNLDLNINGIEWFNWDSEILTELVQSLANEKTPCLVMVANTPEGVDIVSAVSELPEIERPNIYSHWGITGGDFVQQIGLEKLNKVSLKYLQTLSYSRPKTQKGEQLVRQFEQKYGAIEGHNSFNGVAHAYDLVHLLATAVEQAGTTQANEVRNSLENIKKFDGVMKAYLSPFSENNHEALNANDYLMLEFNDKGHGQ